MIPGVLACDGFPRRRPQPHPSGRILRDREHLVHEVIRARRIVENSVIVMTNHLRYLPQPRGDHMAAAGHVFEDFEGRKIKVLLKRIRRHENIHGGQHTWNGFPRQQAEKCDPGGAAMPFPSPAKSFCSGSSAGENKMGLRMLRRDAQHGLLQEIEAMKWSETTSEADQETLRETASQFLVRRFRAEQVCISAVRDYSHALAGHAARKEVIPQNV